MAGAFNPIMAAGDLVGGAVTMVGDFASSIGTGFAGLFQPKPLIRTQIMEPAANPIDFRILDPQASSLSDFARRNVENWRNQPIVELPSQRAPSFWDSLGNVFESAAPIAVQSLYDRYLADDVSKYLGTESPAPALSPAPDPQPPMEPAGIWPVFFGTQPEGAFRAGVAPKKAGVNTMVLVAGGLLVLFLLRKK